VIGEVVKKMSYGGGLANLLVGIVFMIIPFAILYFIVKAAIKDAIKELKNENVL